MGVSFAEGRSRARSHRGIVPAEGALGLFLSRWVKAPHRIGAVAPSSRQLARAMARQIDLAGDGPIIELGGGTGSITRALLAIGVSRDRLIVVERDPTLAALLRMRFPGVKIMRGDAAELVQLLRPLGISRAAAYKAAGRYRDTRGAEGLPVLLLGERRMIVPVPALRAMLATGVPPSPN